MNDSTRARGKVLAVLDPDAERHETGTTPAKISARKKTNGPAMVDGGPWTIQPRRRGRPAKARDQDSEIVEWWKPRKTGASSASTFGTLGKRGRGRPKGSKNRPKP
jgi:hypothetical protein